MYPISETGWTSRKKCHLESGLNQRDRATAGFGRGRSHGKQAKFFYCRGFAAPLYHTRLNKQEHHHHHRTHVRTRHRTRHRTRPNARPPAAANTPRPPPAARRRIAIRMAPDNNTPPNAGRGEGGKKKTKTAARPHRPWSRWPTLHPWDAASSAQGWGRGGGVQTAAEVALVAAAMRIRAGKAKRGRKRGGLGCQPSGVNRNDRRARPVSHP